MTWHFSKQTRLMYQVHTRDTHISDERTVWETCRSLSIILFHLVFFRETTYMPPAPNNSIGTYLIVYVIVQENAIWIVFSKTKQKNCDHFIIIF